MDDDEDSGDVGEVQVKPIHRMNYAQIREENIKRNNQKLRELFGTDKVVFPGLSAPTSKPTAAVTQQSQHQEQPHRDQIPPHIKRANELERLLAEFPHRKTELGRLWGFLDPDFCPAPALVVHGPPGCGKSDLCRSAAQASQLSCVRLVCSGYSTQKQLVRSLWHEITLQCCDKPRGVGAGGAGRHGPSLGHHRSLDDAFHARAPNNFADLVSSLRAVLNAATSTTASSSASLVAGPVAASAGPARLCILFDNIDDADEVDKGLSARLLGLSELCHESIKVIATLRILQRKFPPCVLLGFTAYSLSQIKDILLHRLGSNGRVSPQFAAVLTDVLPRLVTHTNHIGELMEIAIVLNEMNTTSSGGSGSNSRQLSTMAAIDFVQEQLHMPTLHMRDTGLPPSKAGDNAGVAGGKVAGSKRARESATNNVGSNSSSMPVNWARLTAVSETLEPSSLRGRTGPQDLPKSIKFLLVAIYLASHNAKETDDQVFAMRQRGRRKKERAGTDNSAAVDNMASRSFALDRLLSIFAQIACHCGIAMRGSGERASLALGRAAGLPEPSWVAEQIEEFYGDARLFAAINDLEAQRYLVRGPGWSLERPMYLSAVPYKLASEISLYLSFDLEAFRRF